MQDLSINGIPFEGFHICAFFNSRDEQYKVLGPYFKQAIDQGDSNLHIVDPAFVHDHRSRLSTFGINTPHCEACGQLQVVPWAEAFLDADGEFDKDKMLATVDEITKRAAGSSAPRVRIMGDMGWVFNDVVGASDIIEYECEVNEVLERNRQPAVCVYDMAKLSGTMLMDLLKTHPLTLIAGVVHENPYFTPPAELLLELKARREDAAERASKIKNRSLASQDANAQPVPTT